MRIRILIVVAIIAGAVGILIHHQWKPNQAGALVVRDGRWVSEHSASDGGSFSGTGSQNDFDGSLSTAETIERLKLVISRTLESEETRSDKM